MNDNILNFVLFFVTALAAFADFLIGDSGRIRIRDWFGDMWIRVAEKSFFDVTRQSISFITIQFKSIFHGGPLSIRVVFYTSVASICLTTLVFISFSGMGLSIVQYLLTTFDFHVGIYIGNILGDILSFQITYLLLIHMASSSTFSSICRYIVIDIGYAALCFTGIVFLAALFDDISAGHFNIFSTILSVPGDIFSFISLAVAGNHRPDDFWAILPAVTSLLPTMFHLTILSFLLLLKMSEPIIKKPSMLIFQRLSEVKKGVLTVIAAGICGIIKLVDLALKAIP